MPALVNKDPKYPWRARAKDVTKTKLANPANIHRPVVITTPTAPSGVRGSSHIRGQRVRPEEIQQQPLSTRAHTRVVELSAPPTSGTFRCQSPEK